MYTFYYDVCVLYPKNPINDIMADEGVGPKVKSNFLSNRKILKKKKHTR